jgi:hypothetical protein
LVELFEKELNMPDRKSSKGNQLKFCRDNIWYKADYLGYEGLVEYTVSKLLGLSDLEKDEFVEYELDEISYNGQIFNACRSTDFTGGWQLITLERLFKQQYGRGLNNIIYSIDNYEQRLETIVNEVQRITGVNNFGTYMCKMLTVDALFLNEDRHTHNIAVMMDGHGKYKLSPIFDNGAGLLSDTQMEYPLSQDYNDLIDIVKPKTFCDDFTMQLDIAEKKYGHGITFDFKYSDVSEIVMSAEQYDEVIRKRVVEIIMQMRRKYKYLFK